LTERESLIYHYLMMEAFHPLRIVIGYYGYTTEYGLREGFYKKMEQLIKDGPVSGYSPFSLPSLIICGDNTIIKNNGMPMAIPLTNDDYYFHILTTSSGRPMRHLLELIWTRLSYKFKISSTIFGDDFDYESTHPFLSCKEKLINSEAVGWEFNYHTFTRKQLSTPLVPKPWTPTEIDSAKFSILTVLTKVVTVDINTDQQFLDFIKINKLDANKITNELIDARLIYIDEGKMGLLVDELSFFTTPDGKVYAGENKSGEMANYFSKQIVTKDK
jgi:hypothetical protein